MVSSICATLRTPISSAHWTAGCGSRDYLSGKANVSNTPGMMQAMAYVQKWKDIGMLNDTGDALDDNVTRQRMTEGNTLF